MPPLLIAPRAYLRFALLTGIAVWLWAAAPASAAKTCAGRKATLVGKPGNDRLVSKHRDVIDAGAGDDRILGLGGSDIICAGPGNDTITGGSAAGHIANDVENLEGSGLADTLIGNGRANALVGRGGNDTLIGKGGADDLDGGPGNDVCNGGAGHNHTASC